MPPRPPALGRFAARTVVITGAASGMGREHARRFHEAGANVVLSDVAVSEGQAAAVELGARAAFIALDVRSPEQWDELVTATEDRFGPVSVLVNNAAVTGGTLTSIEDFSPDDWSTIIDVNLVGSFLGIRAVTPSMRRAGSGSIVNVSSVRGFSATEGRSAYIASKWGMRGLMRAAAVELGRDGIRVNSVHPGMIETAMHQSAPERYEQLALARVGAIDDVSGAVLFLASDDAGYTTGAELVVDGGFLLAGL